jgi:uncharacterized damage-inducible protein DinB
MEFSLSRTVSVLERTPRVLDAMLRGLDPALTDADYGQGTWSAYNVVGHLIIGEKDDWIPRARRILEHGTGKAFDPFPHDGTIRPDCGRSLDSLLDEFASLRAASLRALREMKLGERELVLRGLHPAFGEVTMAQLLATWEVHDVHHTRQACTAIAYQSRDLVGPWRAYLNTLPVERGVS